MKVLLDFQACNGSLLNFRTYHDIHQYPIFPWVITDYRSSEIDLNNPKIYRDLSKPLAPLSEKATHFPQFYLTGETVISYLSNLQPYRSMQTLSNPSPSYRFSDSISNYFDGMLAKGGTIQEAIPEFFYSSESFQPEQLPPWANGSTFEFVRIQREALESEYVSNNLHLWIDLIFGKKSRLPDSINFGNGIPLPF